MSIRHKISIYTIAIRSVLLYSLEAHCLTTSQERKLEVFQMRCLRNILQRSVHIYRDTNDYLRARYSVHTIESILRKSRVGLLYRVLEFPQEHVATIALIFGHATHSPSIANTHPWLKEIQHDLHKLYMTVKEAPAPERSLRSLTTWLKHQNKGVIKRLLCYATENECQILTNRIPSIQSCQVCSRTVPNKGLLAAHLQKSHNLVDIHKRLVTNNTCPMCDKEYKSSTHAWTHFRSKCLQESSEEQIQALFMATPVAPSTVPQTHNNTRQPVVPSQTLFSIFANQRRQQQP